MKTYWSLSVSPSPAFFEFRARPFLSFLLRFLTLGYAPPPSSPCFPLFHSLLLPVSFLSLSPSFCLCPFSPSHCPFSPSPFPLSRSPFPSSLSSFPFSPSPYHIPSTPQKCDHSIHRDDLMFYTFNRVSFAFLYLFYTYFVYLYHFYPRLGFSVYHSCPLQPY